MLTTSQIVLKNLILNDDYAKRVFPFLKGEYFESHSEKVIFEHISKYVEKYTESPSLEALYIELGNDNKIVEKVANDIDEILTEIKTDTETKSVDWLLDTTEAFCQDRAIINGLSESIAIATGENKTLDKGAIPDILKDALSIGFDHKLGHDYFDDAMSRYEYYHRKEEKIGFDLEYLNRITKGGFSKKTINIILAMTHAGKSALMCHMAAANLRDGKNVLYISLEMAEEEITKRIEVNNMNITFDDLEKLPKEQFLKKIAALKDKTLGKLKVKEYPMSSSHTGHFRKLVNDYELKQGFKPDIIYVDYLNIMLSARYKASSNANSYTVLLAASQELRGLASELGIPVVTASQFNRSGDGSSDPGMGEIAESFGILFGADFICALIATDEMKANGNVLIKQLKNRYNDMNKTPKFLLGFDRDKMKFYDLDNPTKNLYGDTKEEAPAGKFSKGPSDDKKKFEFQF